MRVDRLHQLVAGTGLIGGHMIPRLRGKLPERIRGLHTHLYANRRIGPTDVCIRGPAAAALATENFAVPASAPKPGGS